MDLLLGVDLAAKPERTFAAMGSVADDGRLRITELQNPVSDEQLVASSRAAHRIIAIDAPFGWPYEFASFVATYHEGRTPREVTRLEFRFRETDKFIHDTLGKWPLSVSTDKLGVVAHRAVSLLLKFRDCDIPPFWQNGRSTTVIEVYPAATLIALGITPGRYKREAPDRRQILAELKSLGLDIPTDLAGRCVESHDALDAVICAWAAHLYLQGDTLGPEALSPRRDDIVAREGWIYVPKPRRSSALP